MANKTITELPIDNALSGTEEVPIWDAGTTKKTTVQDIANLASTSAETDPIFSASPAASITTQQVSELHAPGSDNQDLSGYSLTTHNHDSTYQPIGTYSTDIHSNITALNAIVGVNTGDQDLSGYSLISHNHTGTYEPANSNIQSHISSTSNPHSVTKSQVGLTNVLDKEQKVYHGFVDRTNTSLSFDNGTRTFTLTRLNPYDVYIGGTKIQPSTNLSVQIGTGLGQHFIWMTSGGTLATSQTMWSIVDTTVTPVVTIHWDGTTGIIGDERHDYRRNLVEHRNQHDSWGAQYVNGYNTISVGAGAANTFSLAGGVIRDEDIYHTTSNPQTTCQIGYRVSGGATMTFDVAGTAYAKLSGGAPVYDNNGTLTTVSVSQYTNVWMYATNRPSTPIVCIVGQGQYSTITAAQAATQPTLAGFSVAEWKALYRIIVRNVAGALSYIQADPLYNLSLGPAVNAGTPSTVSAASVTYVAGGNIVATNVQAAIEELDTEKQATLVSGTNIKTINGSSILGSGDLVISGTGGTEVTFSAHKNGTNQTVSTNTATLLTFGTEEWDINSNYDATTSRFTPTVAGYYLVTVCVHILSSETNAILAPMIYKNGVEYKRHQMPSFSTLNYSSEIVAQVYCNGTTDYIEAYVIHTASGTRDISGLATRTFFQAKRI